jgi:hypothetical protein
MKKILLITFTSFLLNITHSKAQITLDTIVTPWNLIGYDFYPVQISDTETKYYFQDTLHNTFSLYNMDFTPFMLNISVPEPFAPFTKNYEVIYISRSLFDCESSNIEYAYNSIGVNNNKIFYIMRTDGTQLFRLDSAIAPYCFGCLNGSQDVRPIANTSAGAKLFLYYPSNTNNLHIFSLCGSLPLSVFDLKTNINETSIKIFPNPSSGQLVFQIVPPDNRIEYELVIVDNKAREIRREKVNSWDSKYEFDFSDFGSGPYFYSLCSKNKTYKSGKFILTK